jgi:hypothetical protein
MLLAAEDAQLEGTIATKEEALDLVRERFGAQGSAVASNAEMSQSG